MVVLLQAPWTPTHHWKDNVTGTQNPKKKKQPCRDHVHSSAPVDRDVRRLSSLSQASTELFPVVEIAIWTKGWCG